jgi:magnesium-transporting ATPase (P-type)
METKKNEELIKEIKNIELPLSEIKENSEKKEEEETEKKIDKNFILASLLFLSFFILILFMGIFRISEFFISINNFSNNPFFYFLSIFGIIPGFIIYLIIHTYGCIKDLTLEEEFPYFIRNFLVIFIYDGICYFVYFLSNVNNGSILALYIINDILIIPFVWLSMGGHFYIEKYIENMQQK